MSPKYATSFLLLAIVCTASLTNAFNSDRQQVEEKKPIASEAKTSEIVHEQKVQIPIVKSTTHEHNHHEKENHQFIVPDQPHEPQSRMVKVLKRRHVRRRRDRYPELPADVQEIFSPKQTRSISPNDYFAAFQNQQPQPFQFPGYQFPSPYGNQGAHHNTYVPNGPQINNYYSHIFGPLSGAQQNPWQQQGVTPWGFPGAQFIPVIYIPYPFCFPAPQTPSSVNPTDSMGNVTVEDRFNFPDELPTGGGQRPNTATGISLAVATPPRRPSRPLPPIQRPQSGASGQAYSPPAIQRPQSFLQSNNPVTAGPSSVSEGSNSIAQGQPKVGANVPPCLWAIVSCCQTNKNNRREQERCFDTLGCSGAFYDTNPCEGDLARAAEEETQNFYNSG